MYCFFPPHYYSLSFGDPTIKLLEGERVHLGAKEQVETNELSVSLFITIAKISLTAVVPTFASNHDPFPSLNFPREIPLHKIDAVMDIATISFI